jgi:hypothetical protein
MPTPHIDCPRAKSDMTPCVLRDGELAADDRGCCVGCGERIDKSAPQTGGGDARLSPRLVYHERGAEPEWWTWEGDEKVAVRIVEIV